jgi:hypothetical protein
MSEQLEYRIRVMEEYFNEPHYICRIHRAVDNVYTIDMAMPDVCKPLKWKARASARHHMPKVLLQYPSAKIEKVYNDGEDNKQ